MRFGCYTYTKCEYFCELNFRIIRNHYLHHMKKIAALLASIVILTILLSSCGSSDKCAAYGEYKQYRVDAK